VEKVVIRSELLKIMSKGNKLGRAFLNLIQIFNFDRNLGRTAFCGILMLSGGTVLGRNVAILIKLGVLHARHQCKVEFGYHLVICSRTEKNHGKP
jgi:hypothetical protein